MCLKLTVKIYLTRVILHLSCTAILGVSFTLIIFHPFFYCQQLLAMNDFAMWIRLS